MSIFENFEKKLQAEPKSIVFTEGTDARILSAASRLVAGKTLKVILLGNVDEVKKAAAEGGFAIDGAEILDPASYEGFDEMVAKMVELRKGKMTEEQCRKILQKEKSDSSGIGVKNVNDRLRIYFGEKYGISIESELDVGTTVIIRIPKITKEDANEIQ